jgi:translation initiation factor IF-2
MRARGAKVADLAVLVVAADDGVMPQTMESVKHLEDSQTPFLVALNKIDLPNANIDRVKKQLADNGILVEGYGGQIVCMPVSAKTGQGIEELLEMILLSSELMEIKADPQGELEAVVIESKMDKAGPTGTLIIKNGTLRIGDVIRVADIEAKVRGLISDWGENLKEAVPGQPVEVFGFTSLPPIGERVYLSCQKSRATEVKNYGKIVVPKETGDKLKIILRTDTLGSLEALKNCLPENVFLVYSGAGEITETDILNAKNFQAVIFGFNVKCPSSVSKLAETEKVFVKNYKVIYAMLEDIQKMIAAKNQKNAGEEILGQAVILQVFGSGKEKIAGCRVSSGRLNIAYPLILKRGEVELGRLKITSMKHQKTVIREALAGEEFGATFSPVTLDFKENDVLISFNPASITNE